MWTGLAKVAEERGPVGYGIHPPAERVYRYERRWSVHDWFHDGENQALIERLRQVGLRVEEPRPSWSPSALAGKTIALRGGLDSMSR